MEHVRSNSKGFTLVEVMVSLVVLLVVFLGMMQGALVSIDFNMNNILRDEAIQVAEMRLNEAKSADFATLAGFAANAATDVARNFRNISGFTYNTQRTVTNLDTSNRRVDITVTWTWKGQLFTYTTSTIVRDPNA